MGRPRRRQSRDTAARDEFGFSGVPSGFPFGYATVCPHVAHVAPERGGTTRRNRPGRRRNGRARARTEDFADNWGETGGTPTSTI